MSAVERSGFDSSIIAEELPQPAPSCWALQGRRLRVLRAAAIGCLLTCLTPLILLIEGIHQLFLRLKEACWGTRKQLVEPMRDIGGIKARIIAYNPSRAKAINYRLDHASLDERFVLHYLNDHFEISDAQLYEIVCGAHVSLDDGGHAYQEWCVSLVQKIARKSSHPSDAQQFAVRGELMREMLFGVRGNKTWFQLENTPMTSGFIIRHMWDYVRHLVSEKNIGPGGRSSHTHERPLQLFKKKLAGAAAAAV